MITTSLPEIHLYDIVRLANGDEMIVTQIRPSRPVNPLCGILVNGKGAEYKFGPKHKPVVTGHANPSHPALVALRQRLDRFGPFSNGSAMQSAQAAPSQDATAVVCHLLEAVESGDLQKAKILTAALRTMDQFRKAS
jgi:hypothetical protein